LNMGAPTTCATGPSAAPSDPTPMEAATLCAHVCAGCHSADLPVEKPAQMEAATLCAHVCADFRYDAERNVLVIIGVPQRYYNYSLEIMQDV
jgi:hypothetical protein